MHKSFDDFVKKRISLEKTELNKIFFFFLKMTQSLLFLLTWGCSFLVLLSPVFVLKVWFSDRNLNVYWFIMCYVKRLEWCLKGAAYLLPVYSSLLFAAKNRNQLCSTHLVPWGLKHLHVWRGGAKRAPCSCLLCASVTRQTREPLRWSGPERSTCWFSWWETGAARQACWHADRQGLDSRRIRRCCHSALERNRMCSCGRCPGRAPPTAGSPSDRGGCRLVIGCGGQSKTEASCRQTSAWKTSQIYE